MENKVECGPMVEPQQILDISQPSPGAQVPLGPVELPRSAAFQYERLDLKKRSIRLLRVLPSTLPATDIECIIENATTESNYTCLSYVWGPPDEGFPILLNGRRVLVRANLFSFLRVAQAQHANKLLWIDALCIDQENTAERNHQVQQMGAIFSKAEEVLAWFGDDPEIANFFAQIKDSIYRPGLYRFLLSTYWRRAWIVQEVMLTRWVTVCVQYRKLSSQALWVARGCQDAVGVTAGTHPLGNLILYTRHFKGASLVRLLSRCGIKECLLERDRIYSLLAVCGEGSDLVVDYDASDEEVLLQTIRACRRSLCFCSIKCIGAVFQNMQFKFDGLGGSTGPLCLEIPAKPVAQSRDLVQCGFCQESLDISESAYVSCLRSICDRMPHSHLVAQLFSADDGRPTSHYYLRTRDHAAQQADAGTHVTGLTFSKSTTKEDAYCMCLSLGTVLELGKLMSRHGLHFWFDRAPSDDDAMHMRLCEHDPHSQ